MTEHGIRTWYGTIYMSFEEEPNDDDIKDKILNLLSKFGISEILKYKRDPWNEQFENEAEVSVSISKSMRRNYSPSKWDNYGGSPGYEEFDIELDKYDIESEFENAGLNATIYFTKEEWDVAA